MKIGRNLVLLVLLLSGCTSDSSTALPTGGNANLETSSVVNADSGTTSVSESQPTLALSDAGSRYLSIVNGLNCMMRESQAFEKRNSLGDGTIDPTMISEAQVIWAKLASLREAAIREFLAEKWPAEVSNEIDLIARDWATVARIAVNLSKAPDVGVYNQIMAQSIAFKASGNPGYVRAVLGIGPATETDQC